MSLNFPQSVNKFQPEGRYLYSPPRQWGGAIIGNLPLKEATITAPVASSRGNPSSTSRQAATIAGHDRHRNADVAQLERHDESGEICSTPRYLRHHREPRLKNLQTA